MRRGVYALGALLLAHAAGGDAAPAGPPYWFVWSASGVASSMLPTRTFVTKDECNAARKSLKESLVWVGADKAMMTECEEQKQ